MNMRGSQSGVALVMVLWILLLVTISTGAYTLMARMDQLEAHTVMWSTRARLAAEAGMNMAVLALSNRNEEERWIPDGRPYELEYAEARVEVEVTDERGKVNINQADEETLVRLFVGNGLDDNDAAMLAAAILDWTDMDDIVRPNGAEAAEYSSEGFSGGPANRPFVMTEELLQVIGLPWELYNQMEPGLTVWSQGGKPDAAYAPVEALLALPEVSLEDAEQFVEKRHGQNINDNLSLSLPNGEVAMVRGRGLTYSIVSKATMPNGVWDQIEATIKLGATREGFPFKILRWQEGFHH